MPQDLDKWILQLQNMTSHLHHYKMFHNSCSWTAVTQICQHRLQNKCSSRLGSFRCILALPPGWQLLWLVVCSTWGSLAWHNPMGAGTALLPGEEGREHCHTQLSSACSTSPKGVLIPEGKACDTELFTVVTPHDCSQPQICYLLVIPRQAIVWIRYTSVL